MNKHNNKLTALFMFAHQDDEFGCYYEIERLAKTGYKVVIVYLTSGSFDGNVAAHRNIESIKILQRLGVEGSDIYFIGADSNIPDGKLSANLEVAYQSLKMLVMKKKIIDRLYFLAWEGGHQDHDAVHILGIALAVESVGVENCLQFPLYNGHNLPSIFFRLFHCLPDNGAVIKRRIPIVSRIRYLMMCLTYVSQMKTWIGLFPFLLIHYLFSGTQLFQPVSITRPRELPHNGELLYERRGIYCYNQFLEDVKDFIDEHL